MDIESNFHLGVDCPFTKSVWLDLEDKLNIRNLWSEDYVTACMKTWCLNMEVKPYYVFTYYSIVAYMESSKSELF